MGGALDWTALPVICALLEVDDPEPLIAGLVQIRNHFREKASAEADH